MKKQANNQTCSITKKAVMRARKKRNGFTIPLFCFAFFTILSLCLGYVFPDSLIITIPLVVIPSYFAFLFINGSNFKFSDSLGGFIFSFKTYFNRGFSGSFSIIKGFLKSLAIYLAVTLLVLFVFDGTLLRNIPEYAKISNDLATGVSDVNAYVVSFENLVRSNSKVGIIFFGVSCIALLCGSLVFIHHIGYSSIKLDYSLVKKQPVPMREFASIDKRVKKESNHRFFKDYFGATFFIDILIILAFVSSFLIQYFLIKNLSTGQFFVMALAITLILILPFMNYLAEVYHVIFNRYVSNYDKTLATVTLELLSKYKDELLISEKDNEVIQKMLDKTKDNEDSDKDKKE